MNDFHVPGAEEMEMTHEEVYEAIVQFAEESHGAEVSDDRIKGICYRVSDPEDDKDLYDIKVGDVHPIKDESVEAILRDELRDCYLVCTPTRGVTEGRPILVDDERILSVTYFV